MKSSFRIQATKLHCLFTQADKFWAAQMCPLDERTKKQARSHCVTNIGPDAWPLSLNPGRHGAPQKWVLEGCQHLPTEGDPFTRKNAAMILGLCCARSCQACFSPLQLRAQNPRFPQKEHTRELKIAYFNYMLKTPRCELQWLCGTHSRVVSACILSKCLLGHYQSFSVKVGVLFHPSFMGPDFWELEVWGTLSVISEQ